MKNLKITKENLPTVYGAIKNWFKKNPNSVEFQIYPTNIMAYKILGEEFYKDNFLRPIKKSIDSGFATPIVELRKGYGIVIESKERGEDRGNSTIEIGSRISISPTQIKVCYEFWVIDGKKAILFWNRSTEAEVDALVAEERSYDGYWGDDDDGYFGEDWTDEEIREAREQEELRDEATADWEVN